MLKERSVLKGVEAIGGMLTVGSGRRSSDATGIDNQYRKTLQQTETPLQFVSTNDGRTPNPTYCSVRIFTLHPEGRYNRHCV